MALDDLRRYEAFIDAGADLRRIDMRAQFQSNGWPIPPGAREATGISDRPIDDATPAELHAIRKRFLDFATQPAPAPLGWPIPPLALAAEASRLAAFVLNAVLNRPALAAKQFSLAAKDFRAAEMVPESKKAEQDAAACADTASGDLEAQVATARRAVSAAAPGTLEAAAARVDLGERLLQAGDTFGARIELKAAERSLAQAGYTAPPSGNQMLTNMLGALVGSKDAAQVTTKAASVLQVRLLFYRLYDALCKSPVPADPREAERYCRLIGEHQLLTRRT